MKNRLIAALLMLTAVPFFADLIPDQQPGNAELLAHLKSVKIDIQTTLDDNYEPGPGYNDMMLLWNNLYTVVDPHNKQALAEVEIYFNTLCTTMPSFNNLLPDPWQPNDNRLMKTLHQLYTIMHNQLSKDAIKNIRLKRTTKFKHIMSIIANQLKEFKKIGACENDESLENIIQIMFFDCPCCSLAPKAYFKHRILPHLQAKINAKIAELEAQL